MVEIHPFSIGFLGSLGWPEMLAILIIGVLLFGKRLPEVGRSIGKGIVEFKRGLKDVSDEIDQASSRPATSPPQAALPKDSSEPSVRLEPPRTEEGEDARVSRKDAVE